LILVAYFLEAGLLLLVVPWSGFWERNYFAQAVPLIGGITANFFVRGAVTGLGLVNVAAGLTELFSVFSSRRR
jgi:hypothetical protein